MGFLSVLKLYYLIVSINIISLLMWIHSREINSRKENVISLCGTDSAVVFFLYGMLSMLLNKVTLVKGASPRPHEVILKIRFRICSVLIRRL